MVQVTWKSGRNLETAGSRYNLSISRLNNYLIYSLKNILNIKDPVVVMKQSMFIVPEHKGRDN